MVVAALTNTKRKGISKQTVHVHSLDCKMLTGLLPRGSFVHNCGTSLNLSHAICFKPLSPCHFAIN